jgi:hypothetical protein
MGDWLYLQHHVSQLWTIELWLQDSHHYPEELDSFISVNALLLVLLARCGHRLGILLS